MRERCLLVGLGQIGMGYDLATGSGNAIRSHAKAFSSHPAFELSAAVDASQEKCDLFSQYYEGRTFQKLEEALKTVQPSVVVIATPTNSHCTVLEHVLKYSRPKVILCEKPLAYELVEATEMVEHCKNADVELFVNYIRRADPGALEVKKRIKSLAIGQPIKGNVWYSKGFLNNGSHLFNLLEFWLGDFVKANVLEPGKVLETHDCEPDVQVEFEKGTVIFQAAWGEAYSHNSLELLCPSGRLLYEEGGRSITWQSVQDHSSLVGYKVLAPEHETLVHDMEHYQWNVVSQLASACANKPHSICTGRQALRSLQSMYQIIDQR